MIHLNRDRQNLGQFSPEEVAEGLRNNRFLPTDLAWREGMEDWQPLSTFSDLPVAAEAVPPTPGPGSEQPPVAQGHLKPEWERQQETGLPRAWLATVRQVFTDPVATFRGMSKTGGFQKPFIYCYVASLVCALVGIFESLAWLRVLPHHLLPAGYGDDPSHTVVSQLVFTIPIMLVAGLLVPFACSGIYFLMVKMLTKKAVSFETVFRAYCYTMGTMSLFNLLPVPPIQAVQLTYVFFISIIAVTYQVIALRESAELTTLEAVGVVLLPMILCCFSCVAVAGGIMAMAGSVPALQNLGH